MSYNTTASQFRALLTPSWFGIVTGVIGGLVAVGGLLYIVLFVGSQADILSRVGLSEFARSTSAKPVEMPEAIVAVNESKFAADAAVFVAWAMAGALVDIFISIILRAFKAGNQARTTLLFATAGTRPLIIEEMITRTTLRLAGVAGIFGVFQLFMFVIPYLLVGLSSLHQSTNGIELLLASCVAFIFGAGVVYIVMLLLRLITLRLRVFY